MLKVCTLVVMLIVLVGLNIVWQSKAAAIEYPWCAQYGRFGGGGRNCGFVSFQQCMATVSGIGGFCERNSFYQGPSPSNRAHRRKHKR